MAGLVGATPSCGRAPRRTFFTFCSAITFFVLALLAYSQLNAGTYPKRPTIELEAGGSVAGSGGPPSVLLGAARATPTGDRYIVGVGKADITGPVVEVNFAGYADLGQVGSGLRQRIYSRAFVVADAGKPADRFVYLVLDTQSGDTAVRKGILEGLAKLGPEYAVYGQGNVAVTGTHSHSGPGGWFNYLLPQITSLGFDKQGYQAIVDGAVLSIKRAHESAAPVGILMANMRPKCPRLT